MIAVEIVTAETISSILCVCVCMSVSLHVPVHSWYSPLRGPHVWVQAWYVCVNCFALQSICGCPNFGLGSLLRTIHWMQQTVLKSKCQ